MGACMYLLVLLVSFKRELPFFGDLVSHKGKDSVTGRADEKEKPLNLSRAF